MAIASCRARVAWADCARVASSPLLQQHLADARPWGGPSGCVPHLGFGWLDRQPPHQSADGTGPLLSAAVLTLRAVFPWHIAHGSPAYAPAALVPCLALPTSCWVVCPVGSPLSCSAEGEDSLKKMQLMELAILNGTYRDASIKTSSLAFSFAASSVSQQASRVLSGPAPVLAPPTALRTPAPTGPTLMPLIRQIQTVLPNGTPALMAGVGPESGLIYTTPYDYPYTLAAPASILEYPLDSGGMLGKPAPPCSCECSPTPHHHTHGQWSPAPTLVLRHAS
ncbi:uncharacterized protein LOC102195773 [Pundamilia nyererei]|uniref:Uncharacterized protein LOC102195773 n=1 Tax=Pundamilia nyererei TaxID=303518 RepID=A0A9Y6J5W4_9CICH|nr:PREDICTED: uncharacterized protein LOC102195773 [Pundamilia nyererei]